MSIESGKDLLLALLMTAGRTKEPAEAIRGTTRIEKMVFLFQNYDSLKPYFEAFQFRPNNFGPYSERVNDDLETLKTMRLVDIREIPVDMEFVGDDMLVGEGQSVPTSSKKILREYNLTRVGQIVAKKILDSANATQVAAIKEVKDRFNRMPLDELLSFVYTTSNPDYLTKSKIRDRYLS